MSSLCSTCVAGHLSGKNAPTFLSIAPCRRPEGALLVIASQRRGHVCLTIGRRRRLPSRETVDRLAKRRNRRIRSPRLRQPDHDHPFRGAIRVETLPAGLRDVMAPQGLERSTTKSEKRLICPSNVTRSLVGTTQSFQPERRKCKKPPGLWRVRHLCASRPRS